MSASKSFKLQFTPRTSDTQTMLFSKRSAVKKAAQILAILGDVEVVEYREKAVDFADKGAA